MIKSQINNQMMSFKTFCLLLISTCLSNSVFGNNPSSSLKEALQQFRMGKYCEVLETLSEIPHQASDPLSIDVSLLKTEALLALENWKSMDAAFQQLESKITGVTSALYQANFNLLKARILGQKEKFKQAEALYEQLLVDLPSALGKQHLLYSHTLAYYGLTLYDTENFGPAKKVLQQAMGLLPGDDPVLGLCYNSLANLYQHYSQNTFAKEAFLQGKEFWEKMGWVMHPDYANLLNDFSLYYFMNNELVQGEALLSQSEFINQKSCTPPSGKGYNIGARATVSLLLGDLEGASKLYSKVKSIFEKLGQHKEVATALNELGKINIELWNLPLAEEYFVQGLQQITAVFGKAKPGLIKALLLDGLATVNDYANKYEIADSLYFEEQAMLELVTGKTNIHYSNAINNHAYFYEYFDKKAEAAALYQESLAIAAAIYGKKHPSYLTTIYNLARISVSMDSIDLASEYYKIANSLQLELLNNYFASFDEQIRLDYRLQALGNFDVFFNYACFSPSPSLNTEIQNLTLATKNLVLDYATETKELAGSDNNNPSEALQKNWLETRQELSNAYNWGVVERSNFQDLIDSLELRVQEYERALIRQSPGRFNSRKQFVFEDLVDKIKPREATVDFLTFRHHAKDTFTKDSLFYFALLTKSDSQHPELIFLTDNKSLESIFNSYTHYTKNITASHQLYNLIWKPLEPFLKGISTVHLSPDGLLYQLSFGGLITDPSSEENTLLNNYQLNYYTNLRDFIQRENASAHFKTAMIVGAPIFDKPLGVQIIKGWATDHDKSSSNRSYFAPLDGADKEVSSISKRLEKKKLKFKIFKGETAAEDQIKQYLNTSAIDILHLSTHGYFLKKDTSIQQPVSYEDRLKTTKNPLVRTGLALTGANSTWSSQHQIGFGQDGLLSAQEVTDLDLSQTKLVVLSACETGLGKVTDGEGVFGLQRSFKLVGADRLIMSLWKIPDNQTAELMDYFYRFLLRKLSPQKALRKAQLKMKKIYPPFYWAGFVLIQ